MTMTKKEHEIIVNFLEVIPKLSDKEKDRLLAFGEGMAFMKEREEKREEEKERRER